MFSSHTSICAGERSCAGWGDCRDRSIMLYGSSMIDSDAHDHTSLPLAVVGGGCGRLRGGRHLRYPTGTPMSNLLLTLLDRIGVAIESVGDSTGACSEV